MNFGEFLKNLDDIISKISEKNVNVRNVYKYINMTIDSDIYSNFDEMKIGKIIFDIEFGHTKFFVKTKYQEILVAEISFLTGKNPYINLNNKPSCSIEFYKEKANEIIYRLFEKRSNILDQILDCFENATSNVPTMININISENSKIHHVDDGLFLEYNQVPKLIHHVDDGLFLEYNEVPKLQSDLKECLMTFKPMSEEKRNEIKKRFQEYKNKKSLNIL